MTDKPRDLIQICTDIYYECETIKRLDELTDEALDWHNKQITKARIDELHQYAQTEASLGVHEYKGRRMHYKLYERQRIAELSQTLKEHKEE